MYERVQHNLAPPHRFDRGRSESESESEMITRVDFDGEILLLYQLPLL